MSQITWKVERRKIADLNPAPYNPRRMTDKQRKDLGVSLSKFGMAEPVVINQNNTIIGGHQRVGILRDQGIDEVDVMVPDQMLAEQDEKELNVRLNKNVGEFDLVALSNFTADMLGDIGFSNDELQKIFDTDVAEDGFDAQEAYDAISQPVAVRGDLYQLGPHRLMCGDSTSHDDVTKLMNGELADMVFTDPPYNVDYKYAKHEALHKGRKKKFINGGKIFNDKKTPQEFYQFLLDVFTLASMFSRPTMSMYCCHATKTQDEFRAAMCDAGFHISQTIIWQKERIILALGQDYHRVYEPILFGWKAGEQHYKNKTICTENEMWNIDRATFEEQLDIWYLHRDKSSDHIHPTQKPIRLPERAIKKNCPMGGLLFEPFNGSCSTMLAAHQLGRRCYAMELDPKYVDVAIKRFEETTKIKAVKL